MDEVKFKSTITEDEYVEVKNHAYDTYIMFKMFDEEHIKQLIGPLNPYIDDRGKNMIYINTLLLPDDKEFVKDMYEVKKQELKDKYDVADITIYQKMMEHHTFDFNKLVEEGKINFDKKRITLLEFPKQNENTIEKAKTINLDIEEKIWPDLDVFGSQGPKK